MKAQRKLPWKRLWRRPFSSAEAAFMEASTEAVEAIGASMQAVEASRHSLKVVEAIYNQLKFAEDNGNAVPPKLSWKLPLGTYTEASLGSGSFRGSGGSFNGVHGSFHHSKLPPLPWQLLRLTLTLTQLSWKLPALAWKRPTASMEAMEASVEVLEAFKIPPTSIKRRYCTRPRPPACGGRLIHIQYVHSIILFCCSFC